MPWIDESKCSGCETCIEECPANTIYMVDNHAVIDMNNCIHCGVCHEICPEEAVRHDSEKIPDDIKSNVAKTKKFMEDCARYFHDEREKEKCLARMIRHFNKEKIIAEKTLAELKMMKH
ncbi:MAG: 4Fe-4S binding protein [Bacillota bacterium]